MKFDVNKLCSRKDTDQQQFLFYYFIKGQTLTRWWEVVLFFSIKKKSHGMFSKIGRNLSIKSRKVNKVLWGQTNMGKADL